MGIFLDIKSAFGCVNDQLLLKKIKLSGIGGITNNWISS